MRVVYFHAIGVDNTEPRALFFRDKFADIDFLGPIEFVAPNFGKTLRETNFSQRVDIGRGLVGDDTLIIGCGLGAHVGAVVAQEQGRCAILISPTFNYFMRRKHSLPPDILEDGLKYSDVPAIKCPTLFVVGNRDYKVKLGPLFDLVKNVPNSKLAVILKGDHLLYKFMDDIWNTAYDFLF